MTEEPDHGSKYFFTDAPDNLSASAKDIVDDMEKIRKDTLLRYSTLSQQHARMDDYIHLAYRLGTYMATFDKDGFNEIPKILEANELFTYYNYRFLREMHRDQFEQMDGILTSIGKKIGVEGQNYHLFQGFMALVEMERVAPYHGGVELSAVNDLMPGLSRRMFQQDELQYLPDSIYESRRRENLKNGFILGGWTDKKCAQNKDCVKNAIWNCNKFRVLASGELLPEKGLINASFVRFLSPVRGGHKMLGYLENLATSLGYVGIVFNITSEGFGGVRNLGYSVINPRGRGSRIESTVWKPLQIE